ncbi:hypothetical protein GCM10027343_23820 [Noviherbaspirillum agri]
MLVATLIGLSANFVSMCLFSSDKEDSLTVHGASRTPMVREEGSMRFGIVVYASVVHAITVIRLKSVDENDESVIALTES